MEQTLGKRIAANRKRLGLTQDQLAERLGITAQAISKWENDQSCPDITMLPKLAELFGTTTDELLGREQARPVHEAEVMGEDEPPQKGSWSLEWDGGRKSALSFAALALLAGGLTLISRLLNWDASFWDILWPSALLVFGLSGLLPRFSFFRMGCALFGGCFLAGIILDLDLGGELVFPIILVIFGISLLFDALRKPKKPRFSVRHNGKSSDNGQKLPQNSYEIDGETFTYSASFGEQQQFISMPRLRKGEISTSFGDYDVDLNGVDTVSEGCVIEASCSFGELTLLVPRRYRVQLDSSTAFAAIETDGQPAPEPDGTIILRASASFGEITVQYT